MAKKITIGIQSVQVAPLAVDGGAGTVFKTWGDTLEGTFSFTTEDGTTFDLNIEESEDAIYSKVGKGVRTLEWNIPNYDLADLPEMLGGTYTAGTKTWTEPIDNPNLEFTVKVTAIEGYTMIFNRVRFNNSVGNGTFGRENALSIVINGRVLKPMKAGVSAFELQDEE